MKPLPIRERLVWDYDIPADAQENETFRHWYVARVLTNGTAQDIQQIGFRTIHDTLPFIHLPKEIHQFWIWFFSLSENRRKYGDIDPVSENPA